MKDFISQNKLTLFAIIIDILTIAAIIVSFKYDFVTWAAVALGVVAVILNIKAKRKHKEKFKGNTE